MFEMGQTICIQKKILLVGYLNLNSFMFAYDNLSQQLNLAILEKLLKEEKSELMQEHYLAMTFHDFKMRLNQRECLQCL